MIPENFIPPPLKSLFLATTILNVSAKLFPIETHIKGIVQRDVRGAESRLKRSALINYLGALVHFYLFKETLLQEK